MQASLNVQEVISLFSIARESVQRSNPLRKALVHKNGFSANIGAIAIMLSRNSLRAYSKLFRGLLPSISTSSRELHHPRNPERQCPLGKQVTEVDVETARRDIHDYVARRAPNRDPQGLPCCRD